jgi:hypothetical protein
MSGRQGIRRGNVAGLKEHVPHPLARDAAMLAANRCNFEASGKPSPRLTSNRRQLLLGFDHPGSQRWLWPGQEGKMSPRKIHSSPLRRARYDARLHCNQKLENVVLVHRELTERIDASLNLNHTLGRCSYEVQFFAT